jgi:hypothetical protein
MTNGHDEFTKRLSDYIDGELSPRAHAEIERHLESCVDCREVVVELRRVKAHAAALPVVPPELDLWDGVASRIGSGPGQLVELQQRARRRVSFTVPQLAAACITVMAMSGGMVWLAQRGDPRTDFPAISAGTNVAPRPDAPAGAHAEAVNFPDAPYENAVDDLERTLDLGRERLDAETIRVLEQNLETIDGAIEQSRRALAADPANAYLNNHLASAQQRKLALLRRAAALTVGS